MKTAFKILPQLQQEEAFHLLVEAGWDAVSLVYYTKDPLCIEALYVYHVSKDSSPAQFVENLGKIFETENLPGHISCQLCYNFKECTFVPAEFFNDADLPEMLGLLYGPNAQSSMVVENVEQLYMTAGVRVDERIASLLMKHFPGAQVHHSIALQLPLFCKQVNGLFCTVYQHSIRVVLIKDGSLQLARFFEYTTPTDVAYHLLNVSAQHEFLPESGPLMISGFIDQKSNLYEELYRYFMDIRLEESNSDVAYSQAVSQYPVHFFSPLSQLVSCVS